MALLTPRSARAMIWIGMLVLIVTAAVGVAGCASYAQRYAQANEDGLEAACSRSGSRTPPRSWGTRDG